MGLAQQLDREQHVVGGERLAVVPGRVLHELEGVGLAVVAHAPALGEAGQGLERGIVAQQPLVDVAGHHLGRAVLHHRQHQAGRFGLDHRVGGAAGLRSLREGRAGERQGEHGAGHERLEHWLVPWSLSRRLMGSHIPLSRVGEGSGVRVARVRINLDCHAASTTLRALDGSVTHLTPTPLPHLAAIPGKPGIAWRGDPADQCGSGRAWLGSTPCNPGRCAPACA